MLVDNEALEHNILVEFGFCEVWTRLVWISDTQIGPNGYQAGSWGAHEDGSQKINDLDLT